MVFIEYSLLVEKKQGLNVVFRMVMVPVSGRIYRLFLCNWEIYSYALVVNPRIKISHKH